MINQIHEDLEIAINSAKRHSLLEGISKVIVISENGIETFTYKKGEEVASSFVFSKVFDLDEFGFYVMLGATNE